jgi:cytochrome P450
MNASSASAFKYDPFAKAVMENPLPYYAVLRDKHPVYFLEKYDTYVFSRFQDIVDLLSQHDNTFVASDTTLPSPEILLQKNLNGPRQLPLDPLPIGSLLESPHYETLRQAHIKPFRPKSAQGLEAFIRKLVKERLALLLPQGRFDLTQDYGGIVAASVICHLLGMPSSMAREVLELVNQLSLTDPEKGGVDLSVTFASCTAIMEPFIRTRRAAGADGSLPMIDGLIQLEHEGRHLTDAEVAVQLTCVFIGGTETVPKIAAHGLLELSLHPQQLKTVRADLKTNVPIAVNEMIRYCAPAQWFVRTAHKDTTVAGQKIKVGQRVLFLFGSAARDEREYEHPNEFQWDRKIARELSFGFGQHYCIGVHVARLELKILVEEFLASVDHFEFDMPKAVRRPSSFQWGWNTLPVIVSPKQ